MAKSSKSQMDQDEKKVLSELVKNADKNIETIAKHVGFSKQKTWRIIKRLWEQDLIWGYTAIFDEQEIGLTHFVLLLKRTAKPLKETTFDIIISRELEDIVKKLGITIESSAYTHGEYDWLISFTADNITQAKKFADSVVTLHPGLIEKTTIIQSLIFIKKHYILNPNREKIKNFA